MFGEVRGECRTPALILEGHMKESYHESIVVSAIHHQVLSICVLVDPTLKAFVRSLLDLDENGLLTALWRR